MDGDQLDASEMVVYLKKPSGEIPDYNVKMIGLVRDWVDDEIHIDENESDLYPDLPPPNIEDTPSVRRYKKAVVRALHYDSQRRMVDEVIRGCEKLEKCIAVYAAWFYQKERLDEITAVFNSQTADSIYDGNALSHYKTSLRNLYQRVNTVTARRGQKWFDSIIAFIEYCERQIA